MAHGVAGADYSRCVVRWCDCGVLAGISRSPSCPEQLGRLYRCGAASRCNAIERAGGSCAHIAGTGICTVARVSNTLCICRRSTLRGLGRRAQGMDTPSLDWLRALSEHDVRRSRGRSEHSGCHVSVPRRSISGSHLAVDDGIGASLGRSPAGDRDLLPSHHVVRVPHFFHRIDGLENEKGIYLASLDHTPAPRRCSPCQRLFVDGHCAHRRRGRISNTPAPGTPAPGGAGWRGGFGNGLRCLAHRSGSPSRAEGYREHRAGYRDEPQHELTHVADLALVDSVAGKPRDTLARCGIGDEPTLRVTHSIRASQRRAPHVR